MQTPSVGRIVHYVKHYASMPNLVHWACIITQVLDADIGAVCLVAFPPSSLTRNLAGIQYDARMSPGTWHYPEHIGTVQYHESENEAAMREGPVSNSPDVE